VLAAFVVVLAPFAIAGLLANVVPVAIVMAVSLLPQAPVTKGTIRVLVAIVVFPLTWLALAWFDVGGDTIADVTTAVTFPLQPLLSGGLGDRSGFFGSLLVFVAAPLFGLVTLAVVEQWRSFRTAWRSWRTVLDRRGQFDELRTLRRAVVDAVEAVAATGGTAVEGGGPNVADGAVPA
jgi:hypothetical protein